MKFRGHEIVQTIELRGVYDGWSVGVTDSGLRVNRWENAEGTGPKEGYERRYELTEAFLRGEPADGRWI